MKKNVYIYTHMKIYMNIYIHKKYMNVYICEYVYESLCCMAEINTTQ